MRKEIQEKRIIIIVCVELYQTSSGVTLNIKCPNFDVVDMIINKLLAKNYSNNNMSCIVYNSHE